MQSVRLAIVAALTAFIVAFSIVSAQELELTSSSLWGGVNDIETVGNYSFAAFYNGLVVYDVSDPANIVEISRLFCDGSGMDLEIAGDHAFLADGETGLRIIDISDPPHPSLISRYDTPGFCNSVRVVDDFAYLTDGDHGIWIVDVSDVLNPTLLGGEDTPGNATDIAVVEDWAFVADGAHGVQRINISDPSNPSSYGYIDTPDVDWLMIRDQVLIVKAISHYILFIDISNLTNPQLLNTIIVPESLSDLSFVGDYMLVSTVYPGSIWIFANAGNAQFDSVGVFRLEDEYYLSNLSQFDTYLLCSSSQYIFSLNIINPSQPRIIGNVENNGFAQNVTLAGNLVFIADGDDGLQIYDISDPRDPSFVGYYDSPGYSYAVAVRGDYAFLADGNSGVAILDISDPSNPTFASGMGGGYDFWDVVLEGNYAFLANDYWGVVIYDISDPIYPVFVSHYDTPGYARDIEILDDYAYVGDVTYGMLILDISNPSAPELAGEYTGSQYAWGVAVQENRAYLADEIQLTILDISDPYNPTFLGEVQTPGTAYGVSIADNFVYLATNEQGIQVIDVSDPSLPRIIGSADTPGQAQKVLITENLGYVADGYGGLQIMELVNPLNPEIIGNEQIAGLIRDVETDGQFAYAINIYYPSRSVEILDVSVPADPQEVGTYFGNQEYFNDIDVVGDYAYLASYSSRLSNIDISDRSNPEMVGWISTEHFAWKVLVDENIGYVSNYDYNFEEGGLMLINLSIPEAPAVISTLEGYSEFRGMAKAGDYLFASHAGRITAFDVSILSDPREISYLIGDYASGLDIDGEFLYVANGQSGLRIIDISNPESLTVAGDLELPGLAIDAKIIHGKVALATSQYGLFIVDVSDPQNPLQTAHTSVPRAIHTIDVEGDYIYAACEHSLMIFEYAQTGIENESPTPGRLSLAQNYPNPFNASTVIRYDLPSPADVRLDIYDLLGRQVDTIEPGLQGAGTHTLRWNAEGKASGVYFYKLRTKEHSETKRMLLIK